MPLLKQCTLSGYSSEMPSNSQIQSCTKTSKEFTLLVEARTACLILKRLWPRNSRLCLLGNWTMFWIQGRKLMIINEIAVAIFNPSDFQDQRARKSQLYREMRKSTTVHVFVPRLFQNESRNHCRSSRLNSDLAGMKVMKSYRFIQYSHARPQLLQVQLLRLLLLLL